jgi:hypothetical protein
MPTVCSGNNCLVKLDGLRIGAHESAQKEV